MSGKSNALCGILTALICFICLYARTDVRGDYKSPTFTVPCTSAPPTMDGTICDDQWKDALSINGLPATDGNVSTRWTPAPQGANLLMEDCFSA